MATGLALPGGEAVSGGKMPDRHHAAKGTHEMFEQIVLGGAPRIRHAVVHG